MSSLSKKSLNNYLKSFVSVAGMSGLVVAAVGNGGNANAFSVDSLNLGTVRELRQVITQTNQPPEVIINAPGGSTPVPPPPRTTAQNTDTRFRCELVNGEYTVMYYPESQPSSSYPWAIPSELGGGWTPQRRCDAITERFETYREEGLLELATGQENGYNTICVTTQLDPSDCKLILTVPPGQDPQLTRDLIFDNLLVADDGGQTQGVYTFGDNRSGSDILGNVGQVFGGSGSSKKSKATSGNINLRPFLDPADGGTGQQLTQGSAVNRNNSDRKPAIFK